MNNSQIYNAALAGALAGVASRWFLDPVAADYASLINAAKAFASEVDSKIPLDLAMTRGKIQLIDGICNGVLTDRYLSDIIAGAYSDIAIGIAALYQRSVTALT